MKAKYSKTEFEGYTHRFVIQFETNEPYSLTLNIYSNSDSYQEMDDFIKEKKTGKVKRFEIIHRASKEQDEMAYKFINENTF